MARVARSIFSSARRRAGGDLLDRVSDFDAILHDIELRIHAAVEIPKTAVIETHAADVAGAATQRRVIDGAVCVVARQSGPAEAARNGVGGIPLIDEEAGNV